MKKIKCILILILAIIPIMSFSSCKSDDSSEENKFLLYYVSPSGTKLKTVEYELEAKAVNEKAKEAIRAMCEPREDCVEAKPNGVNIPSYKIKNDVLTLVFDESYKNLDSVSEIFLRASMVLTLTQIENINYVSFYIDDQPLTDVQGNAVGIMKASNFIDKVGYSINNYESTTVTLYFANINGNRLKTEIRSGMYDSSRSLERYIVEQIISGPSVQNNYKTIPSETVILSINTNNGVCYVDFSNSFSEKTSYVKDEIMIYSIVNSLTELPYINKVQISIEGEVDVELHNNYSINTLFMKDLSYMEK